MSKHKLSVVHPDAVIGQGVVIEPFVTVGADVVIGDGTWIGPGAAIMDGVRIGENCRIFPGAIIGAVPQDLKYDGEYSTVEIGNNVNIREYCTINRGTAASNKTIIKDNCLLMAYVHIAHDCVIEENCVLANNVTLAGHIEIGSFSILGGLTAVHQFVKIGEHAFIGGASLVRKDIPPFIKVAREPLSFVGVNSIGLKRRGFNPNQVNAIKDVYRYLFVKGGNIKTSINNVITQLPESNEKTRILEFIENSERGLVRGFRNLNGTENNAKVG